MLTVMVWSLQFFYMQVLYPQKPTKRVIQLGGCVVHKIANVIFPVQYLKLSNCLR